MRDIKASLVARVSGDATFRTLTGGGADPRFYWYYNGDAVIDSARPAFVTYALIAADPPTQAVGQATFSMMVWASSAGQAELVRDRLRGLLDRQKWTTSTGREVYCECISEQDSFQVDPSYAGKSMHWRIGWVN